ncbi:MAG: carbohydrate ABC transporter permease [Spirochaetales bacterium]|nr:carbohydrate ABC transporter permease [Spirochaetales bacterium]
MSARIKTPAYYSLSTMNGKKAKELFFYLFMFALVVAFFVPFYILVVNSFKPQVIYTGMDPATKTIFLSPLSLPTTWDLTYFRDFINHPKAHFVPAFLLTMLITLGSCVLIGLVSSLMAWMMVRNKSALSNISFMAMVAAMLIPFQSIMFPLVRTMQRLQLIGVHGLIFMYIGFGMPFTVFLYHGFIKGVPKDLEEAGVIDGANIFQIYWSVVLPLIKPITVTTFVLNAKWIYNDFLLPFLVINNLKVKTLSLVVYDMFNYSEYGTKWDILFPALTLNVIPIALAFIIFQRHIVSGLAEGAIKS